MFKIPENVNYVIDTLIGNGHKAYLVGGCVRDLLMGKAPTDYDVTTSALPEEVISLFPKTVPTGIKHGTVTVIIDKTAVEVTTFRTENSYSDTRHPDKVNFVSNIADDLCRRDFTVNAMAYNRYEGIIDLFGGKADIENKILKTVGAPKERFSEDALRILRLFRFASCLDFAIESETLCAALSCADALKNVSRERIFGELKKAVTGDNLTVFEDLIKSGKLGFINLTEIPDYSAVNRCKDYPLTRLYLFLGTDTLKLLKPSKNELYYFTAFDTLLKSDVTEKKEDIKELLNTYNTDILKAFYHYRGLNPQKIEDVINSGEPYKISHLKIDGKTLLNIGYKNEKIGEILEHLRKCVIKTPEKNTKENLLKEIP